MTTQWQPSLNTRQAAQLLSARLHVEAALERLLNSPSAQPYMSTQLESVGPQSLRRRGSSSPGEAELRPGTVLPSSSAACRSLPASSHTSYSHLQRDPG